LPLILFMVFTIVDSVTGDLRNSPWGLIFMLNFAHTGPEGMLGAPIYVATYGVFAAFFAAWTAVYLAPLIGTLILGPGRTRLRETPVARQVGTAEAE
jgi:hypothetical protein